MMDVEITSIKNGCIYIQYCVHYYGSKFGFMEGIAHGFKDNVVQ